MPPFAGLLASPRRNTGRGLGGPHRSPTLSSLLPASSTLRGCQASPDGLDVSCTSDPTDLVPCAQATSVLPTTVNVPPASQSADAWVSRPALLFFTPHMYEVASSVTVTSPQQQAWAPLTYITCQSPLPSITNPPASSPGEFPPKHGKKT